MKSFRRVYAAQCRSAELLGAAEKIPKGKARDDMVKQVKTYQLGLKALGEFHFEAVKIQKCFFKLEKFAKKQSNLPIWMQLMARRTSSWRVSGN